MRERERETRPRLLALVVVDLVRISVVCDDILIAVSRSDQYGVDFCLSTSLSLCLSLFRWLRWQDVAGACGISAMPTFQAFVKGAKKAEVVGANKDKLIEMIKSL